MNDRNLHSVLWELTSKCNLQCSHCMMWRNPVSDLSIDANFYIASEISALSPQSIGIMGGEPLLIPYLPKLINFFSSRKISTGIITNGILFNQNNGITLLENGLSEIAFSLDGTKNIHNSIRGNSLCFEKVIQGIKTSNIIGIPQIKVISSIHKLNFPCISDILNLLKELKVQLFWQINTCSIESENRISPEEFVWLIQWIKKNSMGEVIPLLSHEMGFYGEEGCSAGKDRLGIRSNGDVYPCLSLIDSIPPAGNVLEDDLSQLFKTSVGNLNCFFSGCINCANQKKCQGSCPEFVNSIEKDEKENLYCPYSS